MDIKSKLGCIKSDRDERDFLVTSLIEDILEKLPSSYDITDKMTPVQNQGSEGACVGFSGVAIKEYQEQIDYGLVVRLSERFLYEEAKKISGHREGTTLKACAKVLVGKGVCENKFWKYIPGDSQQSLPGAEHNALTFRIEPAYVRITNEKELKASLVKYGAIHLAVNIYKTWDRQIKGHIPNFSWWERILYWFKRGIQGGHAICLTGFNDNTKEFSFKNSWGESWGDKGYGYLTYSHMRETMMEAMCYVDIDDPSDFEDVVIKRVCNLTRREKRHSWV